MGWLKNHNFGVTLGDPGAIVGDNGGMYKAMGSRAAKGGGGLGERINHKCLCLRCLAEGNAILDGAVANVSAGLCFLPSLSNLPSRHTHTHTHTHNALNESTAILRLNAIAFSNFDQ